MLQALKKMKLRQRKGNLLIVVLMSAIVVSMLCGVLTMAASNKATVKEKASSVTDIYNGITFADMFADAFFSDVSSQYNQEVIDPGTLEFTPDMYIEMISGVDGFAENMHIVEQDDGTFLYTGSAQAVIENVSFSEGAETVMKTQFKRMADRIEKFYISMDETFVVDDSAEENILSGETGDRYYLKDIDLTLSFNLGIQRFALTYRISGLYVEFAMGEGVITGSIRADEATMVLMSQFIS